MKPVTQAGLIKAAEDLDAFRQTDRARRGEI